MSPYKAVLISFQFSTSNMSKWSQIFAETGENRAGMFGGYLTFRNINISTNGILFYTGQKLSSFGGAVTDSTQSIPLKIYGVKG